MIASAEATSSGRAAMVAAAVAFGVACATRRNGAERIDTERIIRMARIMVRTSLGVGVTTAISAVSVAAVLRGEVGGDFGVLCVGGTTLSFTQVVFRPAERRATPGIVLRGPRRPGFHQHLDRIETARGHGVVQRRAV